MCEASSVSKELKLALAWDKCNHIWIWKSAGGYKQENILIYLVYQYIYLSRY